MKKNKKEESHIGLPRVNLGILGIIIDLAKKNSKDDALLLLINRLEDALKNEENKTASQIFINDEVESIVNKLNDYFSKHKEEIASWSKKKNS